MFLGNENRQRRDLKKFRAYANPFRIGPGGFIYLTISSSSISKMSTELGGMLGLPRVP